MPCSFMAHFRRHGFELSASNRDVATKALSGRHAVLDGDQRLPARVAGGSRDELWLYLAEPVVGQCGGSGCRMACGSMLR